MFYGIVCASLSGAVGSLFSPGFNVVTNDAFHNLDPGVKPLTVYTGYALQQPIVLDMLFSKCPSDLYVIDDYARHEDTRCFLFPELIYQCSHVMHC